MIELKIPKPIQVDEVSLTGSYIVSPTPELPSNKKIDEITPDYDKSK